MSDYDNDHDTDKAGQRASRRSRMDASDDSGARTAEEASGRMVRQWSWVVRPHPGVAQSYVADIVPSPVRESQGSTPAGLIRQHPLSVTTERGKQRAPSAVSPRLGAPTSAIMDVLRDMAWQVLWGVTRQMLEIAFPQYYGLQDLSREVLAIYAGHGTGPEKLVLLADALRAHAGSLPLQAGQYDLRHYLLSVTDLLSQIGDQWAFIQVSVDHFQGETTALGKVVSVLTTVDHWLDRREVTAIVPAPTREDLRQLVRPVQTLLTRIHVLLSTPNETGWLDILALLSGQADLPKAVQQLLALGQQLSALSGISPYPYAQSVADRLAWLVEVLSDEAILHRLEPLWGKEVTDHLRRVLVVGEQVRQFPVGAGLGAQTAWLLESLGQIPGVEQTSAAALLEGLRDTLVDDAGARALFETLMKLCQPDTSWWSLASVVGKDVVWPLGRSTAISALASWVSGQVSPWARPVISGAYQFYESISPDESWSEVAIRLASFVWRALPEIALSQISDGAHDTAALRHAKKMMTGHATWEQTLQYLVHEASTDDPVLEHIYEQYLNVCLGWQIYQALRSGDRAQTQARLQQLAKTLGAAKVVAQFPYLDKLVDLIPLIPALHDAGSIVRGVDATRSWLEWGEALVDELSASENPALLSLSHTLSGQLSQWITKGLVSGMSALGQPAPGGHAHRISTTAAGEGVALEEGFGQPRSQAGSAMLANLEEPTGRIGRKPLSLGGPDELVSSDGAGAPVLTPPNSRALALGMQFVMQELNEGEADRAWERFVRGEDGGEDATGDRGPDWRYGASVWVALGLLATAAAMWRSVRGSATAGTVPPVLDLPASGDGAQSIEEETLLASPACNPYRETTDQRAEARSSSWQRYRLPLATATFGVAVPATLLLYLHFSSAHESPTLSDEDIDMIVADVIAGASERVGRMKRQSTHNVMPVAFITDLLRQLTEVSSAQRHKIRGTLITIVRQLAGRYRRKQNRYPDASTLLALLDEALDKLVVSPELLSQPERAAGYIAVLNLVKARRASPDANPPEQAQTLTPIAPSLLSSGQPFLTLPADKVAGTLLARHHPDPAPQHVRMQDSHMSLPWTDALSEQFKQFRINRYSPDIPAQMRLDIELYRNRTEEMVDQERGELELQALRLRYAAAYPTPLDFDAWASGILQRELDNAQSSLTADSRVQVSVYEINQPDPDSSRKLHKLKERIDVRLLDVAMGRVQERYPDHFLEVSIAKIKALFTMKTQYVPTTFTITDLIEKEIHAGLKRHITMESISAKKQITKDAVTGRIASVLEALNGLERGPNDAQAAACKVALIDVLEGRKTAGVLRFESMIVTDVFAIPFGTFGQYMLVSTTQDMPFVLKNDAALSGESATRLSKWLMPHLSVRQQMKYRDASSVSAFHITEGMDMAGGEFFSSPYSIKLAKPGLADLTTQLTAGQFEQIKANFDTALHTSDEAWAAFVSQNLSALLLLSGASLGVGAGAGALSLGARVAMLLGSVAVNSASAMLDGWEATLVNDDPASRSSLIGWAAFGAFLGVLGDTADAAKLLGNLAKARKLANELGRSLTASEHMRGRVRGGGAENVAIPPRRPELGRSKMALLNSVLGDYQAAVGKANQDFLTGFNKPGDVVLEGNPASQTLEILLARYDALREQKVRGAMLRHIWDRMEQQIDAYSEGVRKIMGTQSAMMQNSSLPRMPGQADRTQAASLAMAVALAQDDGLARGVAVAQALGRKQTAGAPALLDRLRESHFDKLPPSDTFSEFLIPLTRPSRGSADLLNTQDMWQATEIATLLSELAKPRYLLVNGTRRTLLVGVQPIAAAQRGALKSRTYFLYVPESGMAAYTSKTAFEAALKGLLTNTEVQTDYGVNMVQSAQYRLTMIDTDYAARASVSPSSQDNLLGVLPDRAENLPARSVTASDTLEPEKQFAATGTGITVTRHDLGHAYRYSAGPRADTAVISAHGAYWDEIELLPKPDIVYSYPHPHGTLLEAELGDVLSQPYRPFAEVDLRRLDVGLSPVEVHPPPRFVPDWASIKDELWEATRVNEAQLTREVFNKLVTTPGGKYYDEAIALGGVERNQSRQRYRAMPRPHVYTGTASGEKIRSYAHTRFEDTEDEIVSAVRKHAEGLPSSSSVMDVVVPKYELPTPAQLEQRMIGAMPTERRAVAERHRKQLFDSRPTTQDLYDAIERGQTPYRKYVHLFCRAIELDPVVDGQRVKPLLVKPKRSADAQADPVVYGRAIDAVVAYFDERGEFQRGTLKTIQAFYFALHNKSRTVANTAVK
ncbi:hypothetical protein [Paraburkholderia aspalathi]|uniref:hypothetical protein n=1 Tax=Paraburkholderia aspalathi TaxID=1324617 RepID=UPI0038BCCC24